MEELDLRDLFYMVKKRLWLVIVLLLLATITAGAVSMYVLVPEYSTHSTLILGKFENYDTEGINYQDIQINQKLIGTYAEIAKSQVVLKEVASQLSFEASTKELSNALNVSLQNNSEIIKITVKGTSPEKITEITNTISQVFIRQVANRMQIDNVSILDQAEVPSYPDSPNVKMNIAIAGVLGIMLALFIIFLIEMFDHTIKIPEDVKQHLDLPVLGMIPEHN